MCAGLRDDPAVRIIWYLAAAAGEVGEKAIVMNITFSNHAKFQVVCKSSVCARHSISEITKKSSAIKIFNQTNKTLVPHIDKVFSVYSLSVNRLTVNEEKGEHECCKPLLPTFYPLLLLITEVFSPPPIADGKDQTDAPR